MADTTPLGYRIDSNLKKEAEAIFEELGISPTIAIQMFYKQVIINKGIPFELYMTPYQRPININSLTKEQLKEEIEKGIHSLENGKKYTPDEVDEIFSKLYNIYE